MKKFLRYTIIVIINLLAFNIGYHIFKYLKTGINFFSLYSVVFWGGLLLGLIPLTVLSEYLFRKSNYGVLIFLKMLGLWTIGPILYVLYDYLYYFYNTYGMSRVYRYLFISENKFYVVWFLMFGSLHYLLGLLLHRVICGCPQFLDRSLRCKRLTIFTFKTVQNDKETS